MIKKAIYAFSGDPITFGHIDIIKRASKIFDHLTVAIGVNPNKKYSFSLEQRREMAVRSLGYMENVSVAAFEGLLVDYAFEHRIPVIIKGVRNSSDFDYEIWLHQVADTQKLEIDTFLLPARQNLSHVSSSSAKALQLEQGLIHEFVPLYVKQCLEAMISGQYILGVSGEIGSGKSYICEKLKDLGEKYSIDIFNIELDFIGHKILEELKEPIYEEVRKEILDVFGPEIKTTEGGINRKKLGEIVFNDKEKLDRLNQIYYTPLLVRLRRELYQKRGVILFNAALIAESQMTYLCNNNVLLLQVDKKSQKKRLEKRNLNSSQINKRLKSQFDESQKQEYITSAIEKSKQGKLWTYDNSDNADESQLERIFWEMIKYLDIFGELRFKSLWKRSHAKGSYYQCYENLKTTYASRNRYYHNLHHIINGLNLLIPICKKIKNLEAFEFAWWYHDLIYNPKFLDNEERSSMLAFNDLKNYGFDPHFIDRVTELITATKDHTEPLNQDMAYFFDLDLSILGADDEIFRHYEENIRLEYHFFDDKEYYQGRSAFMKNLLNRSSIFYTSEFKNQYEKKAHNNIIQLLNQKGYKHG